MTSPRGHAVTISTPAYRRNGSTDGIANVGHVEGFQNSFDEFSNQNPALAVLIVLTWIVIIIVLLWACVYTLRKRRRLKEDVQKKENREKKKKRKKSRSRSRSRSRSHAKSDTSLESKSKSKKSSKSKRRSSSKSRKRSRSKSKKGSRSRSRSKSKKGSKSRSRSKKRSRSKSGSRRKSHSGLKKSSRRRSGSRRTSKLTTMPLEETVNEPQLELTTNKELNERIQRWLSELDMDFINLQVPMVDEKHDVDKDNDFMVDDDMQSFTMKEDSPELLPHPLEQVPPPPTAEDRPSVVKFAENIQIEYSEEYGNDNVDDIVHADLGGKENLVDEAPLHDQEAVLDQLTLEEQSFTLKDDPTRPTTYDTDGEHDQISDRKKDDIKPKIKQRSRSRSKRSKRRSRSRSRSKGSKRRSRSRSRSKKSKRRSRSRSRSKGSRRRSRSRSRSKRSKRRSKSRSRSKGSKKRSKSRSRSKGSKKRSRSRSRSKGSRKGSKRRSTRSKRRSRSRSNQKGSKKISHSSQKVTGSQSDTSLKSVRLAKPHDLSLQYNDIPQVSSKSYMQSKTNKQDVISTPTLTQAAFCLLPVAAFRQIFSMIGIESCSTPAFEKVSTGTQSEISMIAINGDSTPEQSETDIEQRETSPALPITGKVRFDTMAQPEPAGVLLGEPSESCAPLYGHALMCPLKCNVLGAKHDWCSFCQRTCTCFATPEVANARRRLDKMVELPFIKRLFPKDDATDLVPYAGRFYSQPGVGGRNEYTTLIQRSAIPTRDKDTFTLPYDRSIFPANGAFRNLCRSATCSICNPHARSASPLGPTNKEVRLTIPACATSTVFPELGQPPPYSAGIDEQFALHSTQPQISPQQSIFPANTSQALPSGGRYPNYTNPTPASQYRTLPY